MFQIISRISILAVTLLATTALAEPVATDQPVPFKATYYAKFKGFFIGATGVRELKKQPDGTWLLTSLAYNFLGKIREQSTFEIGKDNRIIPREYLYHRTGVGPNRNTVLEFNWAKKELNAENQGKTWNAPLKPGTQDKLSYQYMLRHDLMLAGAKDGESPTFSYRIADDDGFKEYSFKVVGKERVKTRIGTFDTVKATRTDGNPKRKTNFWLAPAYNYLLIRFEQTEPNGGGFELQLRKAEFDGKQIRAGD